MFMDECRIRGWLYECTSWWMPLVKYLKNPCFNMHHLLMWVYEMYVRHDRVTVSLFKIVINTLWLVPLRLLFGVLPGFVCSVLVCAIAVPWGKSRMDQPFRGWRKYVAIIRSIYIKLVAVYETVHDDQLTYVHWHMCIVSCLRNLSQQ